MLITCPHCGTRPVEEFIFNGDAAPSRPRKVDSDSAGQWFEYVYLRDNPKGWMDEYAHHSGGCRQWLVVTRNTGTHEVKAAVAVGDYVRGKAKLK